MYLNELFSNRKVNPARTIPPAPLLQHYSLARAAQLLKPGGYAVISHPVSQGGVTLPPFVRHQRCLRLPALAPFSPSDTTPHNHALQEGRAWHTALRERSGAGLIPHELPDKAALEQLLFASAFELVELRDEEHLYMAVLRVRHFFTFVVTC